MTCIRQFNFTKMGSRWGPGNKNGVTSTKNYGVTQTKNYGVTQTKNYGVTSTKNYGGTLTKNMGRKAAPIDKKLWGPKRPAL